MSADTCIAEEVVVRSERREEGGKERMSGGIYIYTFLLTAQ